MIWSREGWKKFRVGIYLKKNLLGRHGPSQDLESGCLKLAIVKSLGIQISKGDHNILRIQP